jgi:hypothetical protein
MGLDMYLKGKVYLDYNSTNRAEIAKMIDLPEFEANSVEIELGYWRKANHIHKWFVDNVQNGVDNCGEYFVSKADLEMLLTVCEQVLKNVTNANTLLPTQSGFFFGSVEYDDWYIEDVQDTIEIIKRALSLDSKLIDFYYRSSW